MWLMYVLLPLIGIILLIAVPVLGTVFWKKLMPRAAKELFWCKMRGMPPAIICHDSGRAEIQSFIERRGSGVVITNKGKYKLLPRYVSVDSLPISVENSQEETIGENASAQENLAQNGDEPNKPMLKEEEDDKVALGRSIRKVLRDYSDFFSKRSILMGLGMPIFFGYSGKLCLLHPDALALYEAGQMKVNVDENTVFYKGDADKKGDALEPLMQLDPRAIKTLINKGFDETQMAAITTDAELVGLMGRPSHIGSYILIIIIVIVAALGILFLPSLLPKGK